MRKRAWSIFLSVLFLSGFLPAVQQVVPSNIQDIPMLGQVLPTLTPSMTSSTPMPSPMATLTPLLPVPNTATPTRTPAAAIQRNDPPSPVLPRIAKVEGMYGYGQLLPLSCESRAAADWARHFKIDIHEMDFFKRLPKSENPDEGFVGSVYGAWGQTPPNPYGVHAPPIAKVLRAYGAKARDVKGMEMDDLKRQIANDHPVIVWVTGHVAPGKGKPYEVDGKTVTVAAYEHTVIVTGYNEEKDQVTILDGRQLYTRPIKTFLQSWGALDNMAVIWGE